MTRDLATLLSDLAFLTVQVIQVLTLFGLGWLGLYTMMLIAP
jgi:hypothetical protein